MGRVLLSRWNPFVRSMNVPTQADVAGELLYVSSTRHTKEMAQLADLYLKPPVDNYSTLEFKKYDEIFDIGYAYAAPKIQGLVDSLFSSDSPGKSPSRSPSPQSASNSDACAAEGEK